MRKRRCPSRNRRAGETQTGDQKITRHSCSARLVAKLVLVLAPLGCGTSDVSIRYLRSESYSFSRADREVIQSIAELTAAEVRRLLPSLPQRIEITVRPGTDVIRETGETGEAMPPDGVMWTVDPARPGGVVRVAQTWLRASLFHEFHHLVRWATNQPHSIVDHAVFEGMATAFERDFAGVKPAWGDYPDNIEDWAGELTKLPSDAPRAEWLYTHPDGRRWIGIKVGTYWVDRAAAASGRASADLVSTPTSDILSLASLER